MPGFYNNLTEKGKRNWRDNYRRNYARTVRQRPGRDLIALRRAVDDTPGLTAVEYEAEIRRLDGNLDFLDVQVVLPDGRTGYVDFGCWRSGSNAHRRRIRKSREDTLKAQNIPALFVTTFDRAGMRVQLLKWVRSLTSPSSEGVAVGRRPRRQGPGEAGPPPPSLDR